jgi:hypothetical protein
MHTNPSLGTRAHEPAARIATIRSRRELARRVGGGMHVTLYWNPTDNTTSIEVWQPASDERLAYAVPRERALDAFYHPFAHLLPAVDEAA